MYRRIFAALVLAATTLPSMNASSAGQDCEALQRLSLTGAEVTGVESVAAGALSVTQIPKSAEKTLPPVLARLPERCAGIASQESARLFEPAHFGGEGVELGRLRGLGLRLRRLHGGRLLRDSLLRDGCLWRFRHGWRSDGRRGDCNRLWFSGNRRHARAARASGDRARRRRRLEDR